jgi:hypothetical protein
MSREGVDVDRARWTDAAVAVVVGWVTVVSVLLAGYSFLAGMPLDYPNHGETAPDVRDAKDFLLFTGAVYLLAAGLVAYGGVGRTPIPVLAGGILLPVTEIATVRAQPHLRRLPDPSALAPWFLPLGIACALLALAAAWLLHRPSAVLAVATVVALAAAVPAVVAFTAWSGAARLDAAREAGREASEQVCRHVSSVQAGWIERRLTVPDGRLRAARLQRSAADDPAWFVVAEFEGEGFAGDADVVVWRIDAPGAKTPPEFGDRAEPNRISAANALAASVSGWPHKSLPAQASLSLAACGEEVLREASGW